MSLTDNPVVPVLMAGRSNGPAMLRPETLEQALSVLFTLAEQANNDAANVPTVIAGGTDIYPARVGQTLSSPALDLSAIASLGGFSQTRIEDQDYLRIGAMTRWSQIRDRRRDRRFEPLTSPAFDALAMAAAEVGGRQIQNRATLGGNICNASPAADGVPALLALNARLILSSVAGSRIVSISQFITGPGRTVLRTDELLEAILIPNEMNSSERCHSVFLKLGQRRYLVISAAMIAVSLRWSGLDSPVLTASAIAVGSCGPTACRLPQLEQQLNGLSPTQLCELAEQPFEPSWLEPLAPITDMRASASYRIAAVEVMIRRALSVLSQAPGVSVVNQSP